MKQEAVAVVEQRGHKKVERVERTGRNIKICEEEPLSTG